MSTARTYVPNGTLAQLFFNRDHPEAVVAAGGAVLVPQDLTAILGVGLALQYSIVAGLPTYHGEVADEEAMLALHDTSGSTPTPRWVKPGDLCTRTDAPGVFWICARNNGQAAADWLALPSAALLTTLLAAKADAAAMATALSGKAASDHTHPLSGLTQSGAADGQVATWSAADGWHAATPSGGGGGDTAVPLGDEIVADAPVAYWRCDDATGALVDSSGGGLDLSISGSVTRNHTRLVRGMAGSHVLWSSGYATRAGAPLPVPMDGSWTIELCLLLTGTVGSELGLFAIGGSGSENESANYQIYSALTSSRTPRMIWEYGEGANVLTDCDVQIPIGQMTHIAWIKDGQTAAISCYINGRCMIRSGYAAEPTGGAGSTIDIGRASAGGTMSNTVVGHVALYDTALSTGRIEAHAVAAGVM